MFPTKYDPKAIKRELDKVNIIAGGVNQIQEEIININVSLGDASASITQLATVITDGDYALAQLITNLTADVGDNNAAIANELIVRADGDSAIASTITTLTATVDNNTGSIVQEATARSTADEVITLISDTQRALFGAAVSDNWDPDRTYNGSTAVVGGNIVGTGDDTVYGGVVYRCKSTHSNQIPPNTIYWDDVDTVAGTVTAAVNAESIARTTADEALAQTSVALSGRVTTTEGDISTNAGDIVSVNSLVVTNDGAYSERFELTAARFGITVDDTYDNARTYQVGEEAVYNAILYRCTNITLGNVPTDTLFWAFQALVPAAISAAVETETIARATADTALAQTSTTISGRVTTLEGDTTDADAIVVNAGDIIDINTVLVTSAASNAERFELTAARFGVTVADNYNSSRTYQVGEEVVYNTFVYRCTAISLGNIPTDTLFWAFQELVPAAISAAVQVETTARATAVSALASDITTVTATADGNTAQITIEATASASADSLLQIDVDGAIAAAAASQSTADGKIDSFYQTTAPTVASEGDIWFDTDDGNTIYTYQSGVWTLSADSDIAQAILDASGAQATADGKVTSFYSTTPPTAEGIGDFWVDTDDGNKLYRWSGSSWVDVRDTGIAGAIADAATAQAAADGKIDSFYQTTAPTVASEGDIWFDTDDGNKIYTYRSSVWTVTVDTDIALSIGAAAGAQATADGKVTTFYQDAPPTAEGSGDLWVDTNDGNKLYRWNLSNWVLVQDTAIPALEAHYGVTLDVNGYITGFSSNNDGTTGTFKVLADVFKIIDPAAGAGQAGLDAFTYAGGVVSLGTGVKLTADAIDVGTMSADRIQFDGQYLEVVNGFLKVIGAPGTQGPIVVGTATGATEPSATVTRVANGTVNCTLSYSLSKNASQNDYSATTPWPVTVTLKRAGTVIRTWVVDGTFIAGNVGAGEPYVSYGSFDVAFVDGDTGSGSTAYTMGLGSVTLADFDVATQVTASASL